MCEHQPSRCLSQLIETYFVRYEFVPYPSTPAYLRIYAETVSLEEAFECGRGVERHAGRKSPPISFRDASHCLYLDALRKAPEGMVETAVSETSPAVFSQHHIDVLIFGFWVSS